MGIRRWWSEMSCRRMSGHRWRPSGCYAMTLSEQHHWLTSQRRHLQYTANVKWRSNKTKKLVFYCTRHQEWSWINDEIMRAIDAGDVCSLVHCINSPSPQCLSGGWNPNCFSKHFITSILNYAILVFFIFPLLCFITSLFYISCVFC